MQPFHDGGITVKAENRRKVLFRFCKSERTDAHVVRTGLLQGQHFFEGIGSAAYDKFLAEQLSRLCHGHIVFAEVHAVGLHLFSEFHAVIYNKGCALLLTQGLHFAGSSFGLGIAGFLHAQLYPAATAAQGKPCALNVGVAGGGVRDKLNWYHE